ncbi:MAG: response regulator [Proteobacteria bacterium]|nr:response regulator [Pseudomonadota bacterium]
MIEESKKPFVLVVDDHETSLLSFSAIIEETDAIPIRAQSGDAAIKLLDAYDFALILLDVMMPGLDGFELSEVIHRRTCGQIPPIIFISGYVIDANSVLNAYAKGAVDYLVKPVHPIMLKNKVRFFVEMYRQKTCEGHLSQGTPDFCHQVSPAISDLAGGIAHQFNNILNIITGHVELLKMDLPDNRYVKEFSTVIFDSVQKMTTLTDKLLAYARTGHHNFDQVEFNGVLSQVLSLLLRDEKRINLETFLDPGNIQVDADEAQLQMVFTALLKNALEAIPGKGHITVRTRYVPGGEESVLPRGLTLKNMVCLEVADDGQGMSPEIYARMFEPFFSTKFQGRGLDLAAVQGIVHNHNGYIDVDSNSGEGTRVRVFLPIQSYKKSATFHLPEVMGQATGTVLVIDDDESIRSLTVTMLKRLGYQAMTAATGQEAIAMVSCHETPVDLALLDIEMPDMKGTEIYPFLMAACPALKVVVCSGYSLDGPADDLIKKGAQFFLQKPFSFGDLAQILQRFIERRRYKRFGVNDGLIVFPHGKDLLEKNLIDISRGGASILEPGSPDTHDIWKEMTIVADKGLFQIPGIPFQFIPPNPYTYSVPKGQGQQGQRNLRFGELSPHLSQKIDYFISNYTL